MMKLNKWTVALAGLGLVSLASAARAEEKASPVLTAVSSTTLSGYVDTSAHWNPGTGNANMPAYRFNGADKADGFNLNVVQLRLEKPLDESEWAAGYRADIWAGPDANTLNSHSVLASDVNDFAIRQAYVALRMPVGNGIDWKVGVFDSIIGYESVEAPSNPNYTRSYGHTIDPVSHTGALASYRFSDVVSASVGVADTMGPVINDRAQFYGRAESFKTYMGSLALTAPDSLGFLAGSTLYGGAVSGFDSSATVGDGNGTESSYYVGATIATPVTGLRLGAAWDYLDIARVDGQAWALAGYASYQATEKLSFHGRAEYFENNLDYYSSTPSLSSYGLSGYADKVFALTATAQYDLWANVVSRLEVRWDHSASGDNAFGGEYTGEPTLKNAWLVAANIIYKF